MLVQQLQDAAQVFFVDPVQHETIGRIDAQLVALSFDLQRTYPGIELLSRQLIAQKLDTLLP